MILIPFSSGLDSTTLVYQALEKKENIKLCYINIKNNEAKTKIELQQREKIINLFREKYNCYIEDENGIEIQIRRNSMINLPQVPAWIMGLLYSIDSSVTEVRMGYCMNDDAVSFVEDIKKIWKSYQSISDKKLPKLTFPLLKLGKAQHASSLPDNIFQETYFCENPHTFKVLTTNEDAWEDCGTCGTCKRAKYDDTFFRYDRNCRKKAKKATFSSIDEDGLEPVPAPMSLADIDMEEENFEVEVRDVTDEFRQKTEIDELSMRLSQIYNDSLIK